MLKLFLREPLQYNNEFMANHVPLEQGENTLTVTTTDTQGRTYSQSVVVTAEINDQYCTATVTPEAGILPYAGELRIAAPTALRLSQVLAYGWGNVTYGEGPPELFPIDIDAPGFYRLEVTATGYDNRVFTDEVAVLVYDRDQLDALLQGKWDAMKARLAVGDVAGAVVDFSNGTHDTYREIFMALGAQLPQVAAGMQPIEMISAKDGTAKYRIRRSEVHQGQNYDITYYIYFEAVGDGLWRIVQY